MQQPRASAHERGVFLDYPDDPTQNASWNETSETNASWVVEQINKVIAATVAAEREERAVLAADMRKAVTDYYGSLPPHLQSVGTQVHQFCRLR